MCKMHVMRLVCVCVCVRVYIYICGTEGFGNPSPFHTKPKAHAEEEEMSEDEQRRSKLPEDVACPRRTKVMEGESGTPLKTASPGVPSKKG